MRHLDRVHVPQLDLFRPASPSPNWWQLPAETRERVLRLKRKGKRFVDMRQLSRKCGYRRQMRNPVGVRVPRAGTIHAS
jgi:hypothetical protein